MTNWGYKAVRKVLQTFGGAELAQQQSGRITGEPGNPEVATLARRAGAESCVLLKNNNHTLPLDLSAPVALFGRVQKNYFYVGNGSGGDVSAPYSINLVQGLVNAGVQLDSTVLAAYESWCTASVNDPDPGFWGHWPRYYAETVSYTHLRAHETGRNLVCRLLLEKKKKKKNKAKVTINKRKEMKEN